ncbi:MAG: hypothetical protein GTO54_01440 [Nitrososphaeria archaeon]|nr:hypothetical protein [Nitrososphaeria archaeon]
MVRYCLTKRLPSYSLPSFWSKGLVKQYVSTTLSSHARLTLHVFSVRWLSMMKLLPWRKLRNDSPL